MKLRKEFIHHYGDMEKYDLPVFLDSGTSRNRTWANRFSVCGSAD